LVAGPRWVPDTKTDWPTDVSHNVTLTLTLTCLKEISRRKHNWSQVPDWRLTPGQTGRLTVGRKLTN
jgi:hypothetical protein